MKYINKYIFLGIYIAFISILESCVGSLPYQDMKEHHNDELQTVESRSEANSLHSQTIQERQTNKTELKISDYQDLHTYRAFKTKEGHIVSFSLTPNGLLKTPIYAIVDYNIAPGFSSRKILPVVTARNESSCSVFQALTDSNSKYLLHLIKPAGKKMLFLGSQGLKGGGAELGRMQLDFGPAQLAQAELMLEKERKNLIEEQKKLAFRKQILQIQTERNEAIKRLAEATSSIEDKISKSNRKNQELQYLSRELYSSIDEDEIYVIEAEMKLLKAEIDNLQVQIAREMTEKDKIRGEESTLTQKFIEIKAAYNAHKEDEIDALESAINDLEKQIKNQEFDIKKMNRINF